MVGWRGLGVVGWRGLGVVGWRGSENKPTKKDLRNIY